MSRWVYTISRTVFSLSNLWKASIYSAQKEDALRFLDSWWTAGMGGTSRCRWRKTKVSKENGNGNSNAFFYPTFPSWGDDVIILHFGFEREKDSFRGLVVSVLLTFCSFFWESLGFRFLSVLSWRHPWMMCRFERDNYSDSKEDLHRKG